MREPLFDVNWSSRILRCRRQGQPFLPRPPTALSGFHLARILGYSSIVHWFAGATGTLRVPSCPLRLTSPPVPTNLFAALPIRAPKPWPPHVEIFFRDLMYAPRLQLNSAAAAIRDRVLLSGSGRRHFLFAVAQELEAQSQHSPCLDYGVPFPIRLIV